ncbi:uncharacterized protein LOC134846206 isoform X2 [Symsagittifera roscoffensis]|uniref:uncharacterized protein LOC134846206 isoform X2 n=1 Tax=Symsagittifera roscoffensis TaxID=84072 RepID=UPI00307C001E
MAALSTNPYLETKFNNPPLARPDPLQLQRSHTMDIMPLKRITGVKMDGHMYNPRLPSLRRIEMDHQLGKLPYEHCRNTTWLTKREFENPTVKIFEDRQFNKQIFRQSSAGTQGSSPEGALYFNSPRGDGGVGASMTHRVPSANGVSRAEIARREMENMVKEQERFSNYLAANLNVQAAPPENSLPPLRHAQTLKDEPGVDWRGQLPVAARALDKHRTLTNNHYSVANTSWR